jgi:hypothetical protein
LVGVGKSQWRRSNTIPHTESYTNSHQIA